MNTIKLKYKNTNTYFINGLLFDTDMPDTLSLFYKALKQNGLTLNDIKYVMCSHYHPDHMGLVKDLIEKGIKLVVLENQHPTFVSDAKLITIKDSRQFLKELDIDGEIIATDSHSKDSIALILDKGECFVGDVEPFQYIDGYKDNQSLQQDWNNILKYNPRIIHFGHQIDQNLR